MPATSIERDKPRPIERRCPVFLVHLASVVCTLVSALGCGLIFPAPPPVQDQAAQPASVAVAVESHNWNDITVFVLTGGLPQRLGMVTALGEATFEFPSQRLNTSGGVRLQAHPIAGQPFTSDAILVLPGQMITWTLENNLDASTFSVY